MERCDSYGGKRLIGIYKVLKSLKMKSIYEACCEAAVIVLFLIDVLFVMAGGYNSFIYFFNF